MKRVVLFCVVLSTLALSIGRHELLTRPRRVGRRDERGSRPRAAASRAGGHPEPRARRRDRSDERRSVLEPRDGVRRPAATFEARARRPRARDPGERPRSRATTRSSARCSSSSRSWDEARRRRSSAPSRSIRRSSRRTSSSGRCSSASTTQQARSRALHRGRAPRTALHRGVRELGRLYADVGLLAAGGPGASRGSPGRDPGHRGEGAAPPPARHGLPAAAQLRRRDRAVPRRRSRSRRAWATRSSRSAGRTASWDNREEARRYLQNASSSPPGPTPRRTTPGGPRARRAAGVALIVALGGPEPGGRPSATMSADERSYILFLAPLGTGGGIRCRRSSDR